jgi:hypothetical protein
VLWLGLKLLGYYLSFAVIGIIYRIAADLLFLQITWSHVQFNYVGPRPLTNPADAFNLRVSEDQLPFGLGPEGLRLATLLVLLPVVLALAYLANKAYKPKSFVFVPAAVAGFIGCFYMTSAGAIEPSLKSAAIVFPLFALVFTLLFRWQAARTHGPGYPKLFALDPPGTKYAPWILAFAWPVIAVLAVLFFQGPKPVPESELVGTTNRFFDAIGKNDQAAIDRLVVAGEVSKQLENEDAAETAKRDDRDQICAIRSNRDLANLRRCFIGLPYPSSYYIEARTEYWNTVALNFECVRFPANTCLKHIRFTLTLEMPVRIDTIQDARNTTEWDAIWPKIMVHGAGKPVPAGLFKLPIKDSGQHR